MARDTAACIGYAALIIQKIYKDSIMAVLPSDHLIKKEKEFLESLNFAFEEAEKDVNCNIGNKNLPIRKQDMDILSILKTESQRKEKKTQKNVKSTK